ncbi:integral membrane [Pyrenophora seminiperda CCB06]|uniref:Integral membrane n=1 Tax=Pyrenophora seminiperda CCB06 TaxID=1302712 RepID=A0A3M7LZQ7_9PLEO|nr:integral membrane [Pyrenophora seminiperda CCB06]
MLDLVDGVASWAPTPPNATLGPSDAGILDAPATSSRCFLGDKGAGGGGVDVEKAGGGPGWNHGFLGAEKDYYDVSDGTLARVSATPSPPPGTGEVGQADHPSRRQRSLGIIRLLRYSLFTVYRRLFTLVFIVNIGAAGFLYRHHQLHHQQEPSQTTAIPTSTLSTLASANFLTAILIRQDWFVNLLFRTAWLVPWHVPLALRKMLARVYCYGGLHSGAAVAGTLWWLVFTVLFTSNVLEKKEEFGIGVLVLSWVVLLFLLVILLLAVPGVRERWHDAFEASHRFLGWGAVGVFWGQLVLLVRSEGSGDGSDGRMMDVLKVPTFWNLSVLTVLLVYPWLRLRRWTFIARPLSSHALALSFSHPIHKFSCLAISAPPLREWHPFATFPSTIVGDDSEESGNGGAGDWTRNLIHRVTAHTKATGCPSVTLQFWIKSHPSAGVLSLTCLFSRVLILTTGSGIGPCLSSLLENTKANCPKQFARLVWSSRAPEKTFGKDIMRLVDKADPEALVIDTEEMGRPDLLEVAWSLYKRLGVEAVFVLSNQKVVQWVVGGLERRGVPAFGPIWDS